MIRGVRVTVADTPTLIAAPRTESSIWDPLPVMLTNRGAASIFLGGDDVTAAAGYEVAVNETVGLHLVLGDPVYGITAAGTSVVHVLKGRQL
jgi:hypothetical protein